MNICSTNCFGFICRFIHFLCALSAAIALHCNNYPSRLPFTAAIAFHNCARREIYNPSSSSLLHLSYNLPCSISLPFPTFGRFSALILHADKSSGRWLCYCKEIQFFSPEFYFGLCRPLSLAVPTTTVLSLFSIRCFSPISVWTSPEDSTQQPRSRTSTLKLPLSVRPSLRYNRNFGQVQDLSLFHGSNSSKLPLISNYGWR